MGKKLATLPIQKDTLSAFNVSQELRIKCVLETAQTRKTPNWKHFKAHQQKQWTPRIYAQAEQSNKGKFSNI